MLVIYDWNHFKYKSLHNTVRTKEVLLLEGKILEVERLVSVFTLTA